MSQIYLYVLNTPGHNSFLEDFKIEIHSVKIEIAFDFVKFNVIADFSGMSIQTQLLLLIVNHSSSTRMVLGVIEVNFFLPVGNPKLLLKKAKYLLYYFCSAGPA